jgi:MFS family permease
LPGPALPPVRSIPMNPFRVRRKINCYTAAAILTGLVPAQIISTVWVYLSNRSLYRLLTAVHGNGYPMILDQQAMDRLQEPATAFWGGLFLTFSAGTGVCLLSFVAAWVWDRFGSRKALFMILVLILWGALLMCVNENGFSPFPTLYVTMIPPVVFALTLKWMPRRDEKRLRHNELLHIIPIAALGLLWGSQMDKNLFTDVRDHLLLKNPLGEEVVRFYYRYTAYPASVLKPLDRKRVKTCDLEGVPAGDRKVRLLKILTDRHWFELKNFKGPDLLLYHAGGALLLKDRGGKVLKVSENAFLSDPGKVLERFSSLTDRYRFFRRFTFYAILIAFPVSLYIFTYSLFRCFLGRWALPRNASRFSALLTLCLAVMLFCWFWLSLHHSNILREKGLPAEMKNDLKGRIR